MLHCGTWVEVPAEETEQLQKLTAEVFALPECPEWAQYAAVDDDGFAYWYDTKPERVSSGWLSARERKPARWITHNGKKLIYDSSDWQNSLVKRLTKLTAEIFEHPECPADAVVAVVNASGTAAWGSCADIIATEHGAFMTADGGAYDTWTRIPGGACFDATDWKHSAVYRAGMQPKYTEQKAPELAADVFSCSTTNEWRYVVCSCVDQCRTYVGCPEWAQYAAVNKSGAVYVYENKPTTLYTVWTDNGGRYAVVWGADMQELKFDSTDWEHSLIERPEALQLPKLTAEVFSLPQCPSWAKYAAVDEDGVAWYYRHKPSVGDGRWNTTAPNVHAIYDHGRYARFDASDWKSSLIERPAAAPKLTADVFSLPECPKWAKYAAVDSVGVAYWYAAMPKLMRLPGGGGWISACDCNNAKWIARDNKILTYDGSDWENSLIERPAIEQLPKLTSEVFSLPQCPEWAKYAAVDADGVVCYYKREPYILGGRWESATHSDMQALYDAQHLEYIRYDSADWEHSLIERQPVAPRPKLTAGVFSLSECPEWARYAAVDADGQAYWYDAVPCLSTEWLRWDNGGRHARKICYAGEVATPLFDASDWKNSLIERPAAVPKWFKPGVLAYNNDTHTFFHVTDSTEYCENYREAKVRPYNENELESLFGQSVLGLFNSRLLVAGFRPKGIASDQPEICVLGTKWLTAEELLTFGSRPQGIQQYRSKEGTWIDCGLSS